MFSISFTALSAILQEVVSVTVSTVQYSNAYHSIQYYYTMALNINNYYIHYYKNLFAHKCYHYAYEQQALLLHVPSTRMRMRD